MTDKNILGSATLLLGAFYTYPLGRFPPYCYVDLYRTQLNLRHNIITITINTVFGPLQYGTYILPETSFDLRFLFISFLSLATICKLAGWFLAPGAQGRG